MFILWILEQIKLLKEIPIESWLIYIFISLFLFLIGGGIYFIFKCENDIKR